MPATATATATGRSSARTVPVKCARPGGTPWQELASVGDGVGGLQLGLLLNSYGIPATIYSERTPAQIRASRLRNVVAPAAAELVPANARSTSISPPRPHLPELHRMLPAT